jgi:hypothetical protein
MEQSKQHSREVNMDPYIILLDYLFRYIQNFITVIISSPKYKEQRLITSNEYFN